MVKEGSVIARNGIEANPLELVVFNGFGSKTKNEFYNEVQTARKSRDLKGYVLEFAYDVGPYKRSLEPVRVVLSQNQILLRMLENEGL